VAESTFRLRVVYGKTGRLRFLSHLELVHACERAVRRAGLEYAVTQGFNPRMKMAFGPALPVGTAGLSEVYDLWLRRFMRPAEALEALRGTSPEGLAPVGASYVASGEPSLAAAMTLADYEVCVKGVDMGPRRLAEALRDVTASGSLEIEHKGTKKVFDLARSLPLGATVREDKAAAIVELTVRMGDWGSLRPEAVVREALRRADAGDASVVVTRTGLRREDAGA
jgi:radical SAM-linked protein